MTKTMVDCPNTKPDDPIFVLGCRIYTLPALLFDVVGMPFHSLGHLMGGKPPAPHPVAVAQATPAVPKPTAPAKLIVTVDFASGAGKALLKAEESRVLTAKIKNAGSGAAYDVRLKLSETNDISGLGFPSEVSIGEIGPGKTVSKDISIQGSEALSSGNAKLRLETKEGNGFDASPLLVAFKTQALRSPKLQIVNCDLDGEAMVKAGEVMRVIVKVKNIGDGPARDVRAEMTLENPDIYPSGEPAVSLGAMDIGAEKTAKFEFFVNSRYSGEAELPIFISISEKRGRYGIKHQSMGLALGKVSASPTLVQFNSQEEVAAPSTASAPELPDVDTPPHTSMPVDPDAYAIVVGIEKYRQQGIPHVQYAARDAQTMYRYLTQSMGFDPKNVILLANEQATKADLEKYFGPWLFNRAVEKSRVFIYFAGHGAPNPETGEGYLIPYEGDPNYTNVTAYAIKALYAALAKLPTKNISVTLDACFSGQGSRSLIAQGARPLVNVTDASKSVGSNTVVLSASQSNQVSASFPEAQHGLLTYFLLRGLKGAADANHDGVINTAELFNYVAPQVEREARKQNLEQTPGLVPSVDALGALGDLVWLKTK